MVLIISAIEHDRGDVPRDGEVFANSRRNEARSAKEGSDLISNMSLPDDINRDELQNLVKLMIVSTDQQLEMNFNVGLAENPIDRLGITKIIIGEETPDLQNTDEVIIANEATQVLTTHYNWDKEVLLESVRILNAADYASYFFESAYLVEAMGLMAEVEEAYLDDGELKIGEGMGYYIKFLSPEFFELVYSFYKNYYPTEDAKEVIEQRKWLFCKLQDIKEVFLHDRLYRLEGGLTPRDLYKIAEALGAKSNKSLQNFLVEYSIAYRKAFSNPDVANFKNLATDVIKALWNFSVDADKKQHFFEEVFKLINQKAVDEGIDINLHFSPLAYENDFLQHINYFLQDETIAKYENISGASLALRIDRGDLDEFSLDNLPENVELALAGIPTSNAMVDAINRVEDNCTDCSIIVHAGLQHNPEHIFDRLSIVSESGKNQWQLHLDGNYPAFTKWLKGLPADYPVIISPMINLVADEKVIIDIQKLINMTGTFLSSNNLILGEGGFALQVLAAGM